MTEDRPRYDATADTDHPDPTQTAELPDVDAARLGSPDATADPDVAYAEDDPEPDPEAARLGLDPTSRRPAPLGLAVGVAAAMFSVYGVFTGNDATALLPIPVVFLGGIMAGAGFPTRR